MHKLHNICTCVHVRMDRSRHVAKAAHVRYICGRKTPSHSLLWGIALLFWLAWCVHFSLFSLCRRSFRDFFFSANFSFRHHFFLINHIAFSLLCEWCAQTVESLSTQLNNNKMQGRWSIRLAIGKKRKEELDTRSNEHLRLIDDAAYCTIWRIYSRKPLVAPPFLRFLPFLVPAPKYRQQNWNKEVPFRFKWKMTYGEWNPTSLNHISTDAMRQWLFTLYICSKKY